jgi:hypothetical protein
MKRLEISTLIRKYAIMCAICFSDFLGIKFNK